MHEKKYWSRIITLLVGLGLINGALALVVGNPNHQLIAEVIFESEHSDASEQSVLLSRHEGPATVTVPIKGASVAARRLTAHAGGISNLRESPPRLRDENLIPMLLSTGDAEAINPVPGAQYNSSQTQQDSAAIELDLDLDPERRTHQTDVFLFVTWQFFTAEFPRFSGSKYADRLEIWLEGSEGRRKLVDIDSQDPSIFPISQGRAERYGYDVYSDSAERLATSSGNGLPAAGMTGVMTTGVLVDGDDAVRLAIRVKDVGDNLLDSMAVIHKIELSSRIPAELGSDSEGCVRVQEFCSTLYPAPGSFESPAYPQRPPRYCEFQAGAFSEQVFSNMPFEFRGGNLPTVIADGETRVPVGMFYSEPRTEVQITLIDSEAPADGGLGEFGSYDRQQSITVPTIEVQGFFVGLAQYHAPETYADPFLELPLEHGPERVVKLEFCFQNQGGENRVCLLESLKLRRPAMLMFHGLWSDWSAWDSFKLGVAPELNTDAVNYSTTNAASFDENKYVPQRGLADICHIYHNNGWYGAQSDVVGHSMGGILARVFLARSAPFTSINRLYTLNSPHFGSPLANFVVGIRDSHPSAVVRYLFPIAMAKLGVPIDKGAIDDLQVDSQALNSIPVTRVLSHALVGVGGTKFAADTLANAPGLLGDIYHLAEFFSGNDDLFAGLQHDLIVGRQSQNGGLPPGAATIFEGLGSIHTSVTSSDEYSDHLFCSGQSTRNGDGCDIGTGLSSDSGTGRFAFFPPPLDYMTTSAEPPGSQHENVDGSLIVGGLEIVSPAPGQSFAPGSVLTVEIAESNGFEADSVLLVAQTGVTEKNEPPFTFNVEVPLEYLGKFELYAIGKNSGSEYGESSSIELAIETSSALVEIRTNKQEMFLAGSLDRRQLGVSGLYDDGIYRDISDPSAGTIYESANQSVASVTNAGMVIPSGPGVTTIVIRNGNLQTSVSVNVLSQEQSIFLDRFEQSSRLTTLFGS